MTIKQKHINANGDTEYTVEHRPSLQCCGAYKNEHGDLELTMHWQDVLFLPIGGSRGKTQPLRRSASRAASRFCPAADGKSGVRTAKATSPEQDGTR